MDGGDAVLRHRRHDSLAMHQRERARWNDQPAARLCGQLGNWL